VVQDEQATVTMTDRLVAMLPMAAMIVGAVLTVWMIFEDLNVPAGLAMVLTCIAWLETQVVYRRRLGVAARPKINVYEMLRMIDRLMEAIEDALEKSAQEIKAAEEPSCEALTMGGDVLEAFQMLLEAAQTKDGEYALKAVPGLRSALLAQGIEAVDYCEEKKEWFDLYPGTEGGLTIRPALMLGGKMIRRGQATEEME